MSKTKKHQVVIVGGGSAGISVAARLHNFDSNMDIALSSLQPNIIINRSGRWLVAEFIQRK